MKKYLFGLSVAALIVFTGCTAKNENAMSDKGNMAQGNKITGLSHKDILTESTIHDAVRVNDLKLVKFFIDEKINLNEKDRFGYTPLHLASRFNHFDAATMLIENGAGVNSIDKYGDTPLIDSTRNGYTNMSKLLICNGASRDVLDKYDMSPLHYASKTNDVKIAQLLRAENVQAECTEKVMAEAPVAQEQFYNLITIDDYKVINDNTPQICGNVLDSDVQKVQLSFDGGQSVIDGNIDGNRWCADVEEKLANGDYTAQAMAVNSANQRGKAEDDLTIHVLNDLYNALNNEFGPDFSDWNAELDEDTLTFRFKNPALMFTRGSSKIRTQYKEILNSFFPRYINILKDYESEIVSVNVEGHTSSRYRSAPTPEAKFEKNRILSQKRADTVLGYMSNISDPAVSDNKLFIKKAFVPEGKSSSELVLNEDGSENIELSRRVEFRIETDPNK
ncbi:ankyrin repeat domain-containing protein [Arcobacter sp. LA11]|uniref:ankyrin repeat domain-containing protein n=1 Tax=Arcobacter sp. LA11 TaxID=1898176 RepID=UPI001575D519|nr:ankyrin repeat domain-containing protein [Arcobacter sp. LA11]